ncbi:DUF2501 domain-containing protein [Acetobacter sacchari]|uniref:DUF2501 domain-containing protein n=1 Tax=Acetobacter sacchari TaxID=2661687 RepID=A0ABS3LT65_9PROT|nr:DUF2501 domain-containing protein [Acetobacter sacchari]MBO1359091.1 DUF2501 domain-containing protein [Acetobacter sacchari]
MNVRRFRGAFATLVVSLAGVSSLPAAHAQSFGGILQGAAQGAAQGAVSQGTSSLTNRMGGASSLLNGSLPNLSSVSSSNLTGVLGYCVQNNLISSQSASSTLNSLNGQSAITGGSGYSAGQQGLLQVGNGNQLSLNSLNQSAKSALCQQVMQRSQSLL